MHSHFPVITDSVERIKRLQSIAYSRDFLGVKADESKILSIIARYGVQLSTSSSTLECTFNVFQTRSSFTNDFTHQDPRVFQYISNILNVLKLQLVHERLLTPGSRSLWRAAPHVSADGDAQPLLLSQYCQVQLK